MATFKERYEELFGPTPDYDPIAQTAPDELIGQTRRRALDMQALAPDASPRRAIPIRDLSAPGEEQGALGGLFKTGAAKVVAEPLVGAGEYLARQTAGRLGFDAPAEALQGVRDDMAAWREGVYSRMNPEVMDMVGRELLTLDPDKTIWRGGPLEVAEAVLYKVVEQTPSLLATLVPGAIMMRAGAMGKGVTYLGASEAGLSLGAIQNEIADGVNEMSTEDLMKESYRFAQLMEEYGDEGQARTELIREAQGMAPLIGGVAVGAISAAAGRYLTPVFDGKSGLGLGQRIGRTAISEGLIQEGPQESVEQVASNIAAAVYDEDRNALEGVAESYAQGALLGAIMGGGVGGILGTSGTDEDVDPTTLDRPDAPSAFRPGSGGPRGPQQALPLDFGEEQRSGPITQQEDMFAVPDELFDEQGNYVGNVAAQAAAAQAEETVVDPAIAAAVQANIRSDQKMDDMFQTNPQREQEYPSQNIQTEMFPRAAPTGGMPAVPMTAPITGANEQQEMFPGPEKRSLGNRPVQMDDMPIPEPEVDISAQMDQLERGMRDGVYLAAEQEVDPNILGDFPMVQDFDGRGGDMIFADEETADYWMDQLAQSAPEDLQQILGAITGAGTGKPIDGRLAVQKIGENGGVEQETLVSTLEEARQVQEEMGGETRVLTAEEAVARRQQMAAGDLFAEPEPEPEGTPGGTPRTGTGRHRVRFTDDTGQVIEDRTFSDVRRANKYADELADEYGITRSPRDASLVGPVRAEELRKDMADSGASITVTPVRTMPKRKTKPTQDEQKAELAKRKKKATYKTEGEQVADEIRKRVPMEERGEMTEAAAASKTREGAAKNLLTLAAKQLDKEQQKAISGFFPPETLEFKDAELEADYRAAWQDLYAADFIIQNKAVVPLEFRGTVVSKAQRDKKKAIEKITAARKAGAPRRRVEKVFREARRTDDSTVQQLGYNADKIAELLGVERAKLTAAEQDQIEVLKATRDTDDTGLVQGEQDEGFDAAEEDLLINEKTTKEDLDKMTDAELALALDDALRWRVRVNKRLTPARVESIKQTAPSRSLKIKQIMRTVTSMRNKSESDARIGGARIVTNVTKRKKGGYNKTTRETKALTSVSEQYEEGADAKEVRESEAKQIYDTMSERLLKAVKRVKGIKPEVDEYGDLTPTGVDQIMGIFWADSIIELSQAVLELRRANVGATNLAKALNTSLNRIGTGSENLFGKEFAWAARETLRMNAKGMGRDLKRIAEKVQSHNKDVAAAANHRRNREKWGKNSDYKQFVAPIVKKFVESYYNGEGSYRPTLAEAQNLSWALDTFRAQGMRKDFAEPIQKMLTDFGFRFKKNKMVIEQDEQGNFDFTPKDAHLMNRLRPGENIITTRTVKRVETSRRVEQGRVIGGGPYEPVTLTYRRPEGELDQRIRDRDKRADRQVAQEKEKLEDVRHVRATQIFAAFRKIMDNKKSTIRKMSVAEDRFLQDLKAEGFITQMGSEFVTIKFPHRWTKTGGWQYRTITYRRFGKALWQERIRKADARGRASAIRKDYTKTKARVADRTDTMSAYTNKNLEPGMFIDYMQEKYSDTILQEMNEHGDEINAAAGQLGDFLNDRTRPADLNAILGAVTEILPSNSFFGRVLNSVKDLNMEGVTVTYDWGNKLGNKAGRYYGRAGVIVLNQKVLAESSNPTANALHALTHEAIHAASLAKLKSDRRLNAYVENLRQQMVDYMNELGLDTTPYGLKNTAEFVAEAFSNPEFQTLMQFTPVDNTTLWKKFVYWLKTVLNLDYGTEFNSVFDALVSAKPVIFSTPGARTGGVADVELAKHATAIWNKVEQTYDTEQRARKAATAVRTGTLRGAISHAFHSMRQLRERYEKYFGGENGPLARYMDAFNGRNARNNKLMQLPESISRTWTQLREKHGTEQELEFSRLATESTLKGFDPSKLSTHERNKKSHAAQRGEYAVLRRRWQALPADYKQLWETVTTYYQSSLENEVDLMLLNAIRGVVTSGPDSMDIDVFNSKYNKDNIRKFADSKDMIAAEFGEYLGEQEDNLAGFIQSVAQVPAMKQGVYFPLMRYGDFAVYAKRTIEEKVFTDSKEANGYAAEQRAGDPSLTVGVRHKDGKFIVKVVESEFVTGESMSEVLEARERLVEEYGAENVGQAGRKLELPQESAIQSNAALNSIIESLGENKAAANAIKQFYLRNLSDQSFRKREIKRQNRRGVNYDLQHRNFANYASQSAYYRAQLEYGWQMSKGLADMREYLKNYVPVSGMSKEQLDNVYNTLLKRDQLTTSPIEINKFARKGIALTQFYMLTSASYHMINSTQPWMVTAPTMAGRHGWGNALSAMKNAQGLIKAPIFTGVKKSKGGLSLLPWLKGADVAAEEAFGIFDDLTSHLTQNDSRAEEHIAMLEKLRETSVLEVSPLTELREIAGGKTDWKAKVLDASRAMAHMVEVNNRVLTAIAAYDLEYARQKNGGAGEEAAREAATKYAEDMVSQTQFDYSTANKPPAFMRLPIVFQFMQWSQHIYAHLIRHTVRAFKGDKDSRKIVAGLLGTHAAVAGAVGVTLQPIKMAFGMAMMALGDDDEPYTFKNALSGATFDRTITSATNDLFGTTVSTILSRGLPAALGADVSVRMSLGTLFFIDLRGDTPESVAGSLLSSFGGASINQALTFGRGLQYFGSGDYTKGLEALSPKFMRDILRAGRFATEGLVNRTGDTVLDTSDLNYWDVALQAVGFTPTDVGRFYAGQAAIKDKEGFVRDRKIELMKDFRTADMGQRAAIMDKIVEFNRSFPQEAITRSALLRNLKGKIERELQYERYGAAIDEKKAALYAGYGEPYR